MYNAPYQNCSQHEQTNTPPAIALSADTNNKRKPLTNSLIFITFILLMLSLTKLSMTI